MTDAKIANALKAYELGVSAKSLQQTTGIDILGFILSHAKPDTETNQTDDAIDESVITRLYCRRLTHGTYVINEKPLPDSDQGSKGQKNRIYRITRRLYKLGADVSLISELTNLTWNVILLIVPELAPRRAGDAEPTNQEVFHGTPTSPEPPESIRLRTIGVVGGERVYLHFVDGPEPGFVIGKRCPLNPHAEPPTPSLKERIIDATLRTELVEPDLKPAVRERALDTFNGFQGSPVEKATLAINHAYTELSTGN